MNLLYVQAVHDIERVWVLPSKEQAVRLQELQQRNSKKDFLRFVRTLKYYGYVVFKRCLTDYPAPDTSVIVSAGNQELNFRFELKHEEREVSFKVTRMRCWRISSMLPDVSSEADRSGTPSKLELAFEYLVARNTLKWITIFTNQAILISMCLQGMVDELIMKKDGQTLKQTQMKSNEQSQTSKSSAELTPGSATHRHAALRVEHSQSCDNVSNGSQPAVPSLHSHKSTEQNALHTSRSLYSAATTDNDAFDGIHDEDL